MAGDIVRYVPMGDEDDVPSDAPGLARLSSHYMVLLPDYYKPADLQSDKEYHAALVITKNPIGPSTLLVRQQDSPKYKAENIHVLQTLAFDAHSRRRSLIIDDDIEGLWQWQENTRVGYQIKIVHQDALHAIIYPGKPTFGLKLTLGSLQQLLKDLGEEDDELENARLRE
ncbi:MAG: hypothetical protein Q9220_001336 [cf. Caloplaca sp. 1 TL-2023]